MLLLLQPTLLLLLVLILLVFTLRLQIDRRLQSVLRGRHGVHAPFYQAGRLRGRGRGRMVPKIMSIILLGMFPTLRMRDVEAGSIRHGEAVGCGEDSLLPSTSLREGGAGAHWWVIEAPLKRLSTQTLHGARV